MKVFLTGATGYIGSAVADKLLAAGHTVLGLSRSSESDDKLRSKGIEPYRGDLTDLQSLAHGTRNADGVIHTGNPFNPQDFSKVLMIDRNAVDAMLDALEGTDKPFVYTSGTRVIAPSEHVFDEDTPFTPDDDFLGTRAVTEQIVFAAAARGIRSIVLRPPVVYGRGGSVHIPFQMQYAKQTGVVRYIKTGDAVLSTVHVDDLADLYLLAIEHALPGSLFNTASGEVTTQAVAEAISHILGLGGQVESWLIEQASEEWGTVFVRFWGTSNRTTGEKARKVLAWNPKAPNIIDDILHGSYHQLAVDG